ncbi:MAG: hypothetical protein M3525_00115 [Acidobacteriota bacterium]|nr:hypothetical protein [Acidobacteriota bacterium]
MIVISDTTPLHYLILLEKADLLEKLFGKIIIPEAVFREMRHDGTPEIVRDWTAFPPAWIEVKTPSPINLEKVKNSDEAKPKLSLWRSKPMRTRF